MSAFDEVLAENWIVDEFGEVMATADGDQRAPRLNVMQDGRRGQVVGAVCVLGKQALARIADLVEEREKNGLDDRAAAKMIDDIAFEMQKLREGT